MKKVYFVKYALVFCHRIYVKCCIFVCRLAVCIACFMMCVVLFLFIVTDDFYLCECSLYILVVVVKSARQVMDCL